jgi:hypothetical protein
MKGYKGFDKDLKCSPNGNIMQYEIGKVYETDKKPVRCTNNGFHFCLNPFDVFGYYPPSVSRYCEVEGDGDIDKGADDTKVACSKLQIGLEIGLKGMIEAGLKFILEKATWSDENKATGDRAGAQATGYRAGAQATGYQAGAQATGDQAGAQATGNRAGAQATGDRAGAQATGYRAGAQATGDRAGAQATGNRAGAQATGIMAMASTNGYESTVTIDGSQAVGCALGYKSKAKGTLGSWLVIAERDDWDYDSGSYPIKQVKAVKVDGETIKADTFYILKDGEFVEADD